MTITYTYIAVFLTEIRRGLRKMIYRREMRAENAALRSYVRQSTVYFPAPLPDELRAFLHDELASRTWIYRGVECSVTSAALAEDSFPEILKAQYMYTCVRSVPPV